MAAHEGTTETEIEAVATVINSANRMTTSRSQVLVDLMIA